MSGVHLLVNLNSGNGKVAAFAEEVAAEIASYGHDVTTLAPSSVVEISDYVSAAVADGMERLVVIGGDGLIHHALPALARTEVTLGIVPAGTGNDFARALSISTDRGKALESALGIGVPIDLMRSGEQWAASVVTGGWSARVNARANQMRFLKGQGRYTVAALLELGAIRPIELKLVVDDTTYEVEASLFAIGNTRFFGGGMNICPQASSVDGVLDVTIVGPASRTTFARVLPKVFSGKHVEHKMVNTFVGSSVRVRARAQLWADGEPFGAGQADLQAIPGALLVAGASPFSPGG